MIHELRIYRFHEGQKLTFLAEFKKAKRFMAKYGITFVWIRSFANAKARDQAIEAYYSSPEWGKIVDTLRPTIRRREVRVMKALPYSTIK
jgi:hypothetical protein